MGAYLSSPKIDKVSSDQSNEKIICGASSMQGWRRTQEDAHNCILQYDGDASLFAVYDGHGGKEVAEYTAQELPEFIKKTASYLKGDYIEALKEAFLKFDESLKEPKVIAILKEIAGNETHSEAEDENLGNLKEEAEMPIEEVMAKYASTVVGSNSTINLLRSEDKKLTPPVSPYLRCKGSTSSSSSSSTLSSSDFTSCSQETIKCSETSLSKGECSSSRSMYSSIAESEVSSSSSTSDIPRKSHSENYSNGGSSSKIILDSTSNGIEEDINESNALKEVEVEITNQKSKASVEKLEAKLEMKEETSNENSSDLPDSSGDSNKTDNTVPLVNGNGAHSEEVHSKTEDDISSSVENGKVKNTKGKGKGKALVKRPPKIQEKKESESPEQLFKKFVDSEPTDGDDSDSDSDDVTFTGPDSTSDDEEVGEGEGAEEEEVGEGGEEDEDDEDEEEDEDSEDYDEEDDDEEDAQFSMSMSEELRQYLRSDGRVNNLRHASTDSRDCDDDGVEDGDEDDTGPDDDDGNCCKKTDDFGKNFLINVLKKKLPGSDSGCTAVVALVKGNKIYVANAGDSRCIISKNGEVVEMSLDHKPEDELEMARIVKAGGKVTYDGRVNGGLNLSRALGDHFYKKVSTLPAEEQMISPLPDVKIIDIDPEVEFMVLACDGIWNFMSSKEVIDFVRPRLQEKREKISKVCEELFDHCLAPNTQGDGTGCDNMTAVIVQFLNSNLSSQRKRRTEEDESEDTSKRQKTEDVSSTDSKLE